MIKFGEYILDVEDVRLLHVNGNSEILIEPKLFELLLLFIERPNIVISRQDILEHLWAGSLVTDNAINKLIGNLRKLLGDDAKNPSYIQTIPKRGYRLVCDVDSLKNSTSSQSNSNLIDSKSTPNRTSNCFVRGKWKTYTGISLVVILSIVVSILIMEKQSDNSFSSVSYSVALTRDQGTELSPIMHPNNKHLYYLKLSDEQLNNELWLKNIDTSSTKQVEINANISHIISIVEKAKDNTSVIFYLDRQADNCGVYKATLSALAQANQRSQAPLKLFDCSDKRVKDIDYHAGQNTFYYAAQPQNYWPNQIYAFDVETKEHRLVTQVQPKGWGHHSLDISPNGEKLLVMSTDSDYKTQLLSLNLLDNKIIKGIKFEKPVYEAIWHHDSEQIYYFSSPPAHRIIKSDLNGENATEIINSSEELLPKISRLPDGKNILFSTENKNYNNRWLVSSKKRESIDNSSVFDIYPALFHKSDQYLFVSKRSGRMQLYLANSQYKHAKIVTNLLKSHWLKYVSISEDDKHVLLSADNKVYQIPVDGLNGSELLTAFNQEHLVYESKDPIISLDWLSNKSVAITTVNNGNPELVTIQISHKKQVKLGGRWAYGLKDSEQPGLMYLIEQQSNALYHTSYSPLKDNSSTLQRNFINTQISLPTDFYHAKVDSNNLYYVNTENGNEYLYVVPLNKKYDNSKILLNDFSSYDVSKGSIIVSDADSIEGDVHRTMY